VRPDNFKEETAALKAAVEKSLKKYLESGGGFPAVIFRAVNYSVNAGGKRIRPLLMLLAGRALSLKPDDLMPAACAIEMIHTYSLIHDDLPAMDNDDLRRGKPTCHVKFGEANAILAGDALLTLAFKTILSTRATARIKTANIIRAASLLAEAAGIRGMVGGQAADMIYEGKKTGIRILSEIHKRKTGALIRAAVLIPAVLSGADRKTEKNFEAFGDKIGLAFQVADDILDITSSSQKLGKTAGKDIKKRKSTYPAIYGIEKSRQIAGKLMLEAKRILCKIKGDTGALRRMAEYVVFREN
ncbi:MAG TPA: polyprenyl synthetase family protein, partial [Candidatus Goldiibacteriota bacterium]|nr:polyprenyl synthetase family protein [Candidatus Goldiibacteriota bacterium]